MSYENICVPSFLHKNDDSRCRSCDYRNMDDGDGPCGDCMEIGSRLDEDTGIEFMARCRRHLESLPASVSGKGGFARIHSVADVVFHDFALDEVNGWIILLEYNSRCQPPWSVDALRHMMKQAMENPPKGHNRGLLRDRFLEEIEQEFEEDWRQRNNTKAKEERTDHELQDRCHSTASP